MPTESRANVNNISRHWNESPFRSLKLKTLVLIRMDPLFLQRGREEKEDRGTKLRTEIRADGQLAQGGPERGIPAGGEPTDDGFLLRDSSEVDPAGGVVEGEGRREAEEAGDGSDELGIGGWVDGVVGEGGRREMGNATEDQAVDVGGCG